MAVLCEVGYAKWHIYIVFQRLYQARCKSLRLGWQLLSFRVQWVLSGLSGLSGFTDPSVVDIPHEPMFKEVLCEVKNAKRHIYIGMPAPIPSAL